MQHIKKTLTIYFCIVLFAIPAFAGDSGRVFDSEKMIAELEKKLELSREQWKKLKPVIAQKSKELQESMHDSVDKGVLQLEELSKELKAMSENAEMKVKEMLSSEEARKLREYMGKIDEDAVKEARDRMVADLTALLELTEEQAAKIKPVLEDSMIRLSALFSEVAQTRFKELGEVQERI